MINALKHAFPDRRDGLIKVDYRTRGPNWTLSVTDNGVGMPEGGEARPGLGTSLVEALANQLKALATVADAKTGASISLIHNQSAAVFSGEMAAV